MAANSFNLSWGDVKQNYLHEGDPEVLKACELFL
jgi:hypothetical protein